MPAKDSDYLFNQIHFADYLKDTKDRLAVTPLVLDLGHIQAAFTTATVKVFCQADQDVPANGARPKVGYQLSVVIPFSGDPGLWHVRPAGMSRGLKPRGVVDAEQRFVRLTFTHTDVPISNWYAHEHDKMLKRIKVFINCQANAIAIA